MNVQVLCIQLQKKKDLSGKKDYYLDLDSKHVSSFKVKRGESAYSDDIHVINLLKDDVKVGFIALEQNDNKMNISAIEVNKQNRMKELQKVLYVN